MGSFSGKPFNEKSFIKSIHERWSICEGSQQYQSKWAERIHFEIVLGDLLGT